MDFCHSPINKVRRGNQQQHKAGQNPIAGVFVATYGWSVSLIAA
jgi:hypothetical protein